MKLNIIGVLFAAGVGLTLASPAEAAQNTDEVAKSAAGVGLTVANPAEADQKADQVAKSPISLNGPEFDPGWVLPALLIAGFATGYGVRSLVSSRRRRRARGLSYSSLTSDGQPADNSHILSTVPRDDVGDLQSPWRARTAARRQSS